MKGVKEISLSQFSVEMFLFQYQQHVNVFVVGYESRCGNRLKVCFLFCLFWVLQWLRYIKHWFIFIYRICFYCKTLKTLLSDMWLLAKAILFSKWENPGNMLQTKAAKIYLEKYFTAYFCWDHKYNEIGSSCA